MRALKKIKVIGYPFAGGQPRGGVELTPAWLSSQQWFKNLARNNSLIEYEEVEVTDQQCNSLTVVSKIHEQVIEAKNIYNVVESSMNLRKQTYKALKEGFYPIVLGGDHSQAIGSIFGMKQAFPEAKLLWIDAHIDANTPESSPSKNAHGMPLAYLSGIVPMYHNWQCVNLEKDLCYFGIRSYEPEEEQLIKDNNVLNFVPGECRLNKFDEIEHNIKNHFGLKKDLKDQYWISFDIDGIDNKEFKSTGTAEGDGVSIEFAQKIFEKYTPGSIGMDFTEVNFQLTDGQTRYNDEQTFRQLFEFITHQINQPVSL